MRSPADASSPTDSLAEGNPETGADPGPGTDAPATPHALPPGLPLPGDPLGPSPEAPSPRIEDSRERASAREVAAAICPYLASAGGSWRMTTPSSDHRCRALAPPAPQTPEKQRRHCLSAEHVHCSLFQAAREARVATLAGGSDPRRVLAGDEARRPLPHTAPILMEKPRLIDQVSRLQLDRTPGQLALIVLMVLAFAVVALSRLSTGSTPVESPGPSAIAIAPSPSVPTPAPRPSIEPSVTPSAAPSASPSPSYRTTYRVKKGDTLVGVAAKFKTTAAAIRRLNNLKTSTLHVGQVLKIP
jgi:LysM repeat protein